ncbi:MAG: cytochrome c [Bacteroidota bacterium]|nr:cytochrome c [Bacteroidota bacterium]
MKLLAGIITVGVLISGIFSISGSKHASSEKNPILQETRFQKGKKIYDEKCLVCHQSNGEGITGAFPPLANSDYLLADKKRAVEQVLNGSNEEMIVNGVTYKTPMPPQVDNHEDAVAVINYVLNAWGNEGGTISLEEVKDIKIKR